MTHTHRPRALEANLSTQSVGAELLVYDEVRHQAFCLNPTSAAVWTLANGTRTAEQIAAQAALDLQAPITEEIVVFALTELRRDGLLQAEAEPLALAPPVSRRDLMRKLGAGAVMMVPVVAAIMAPQAAQAYNGCLNCSANARRHASKIGQFAIADPNFNRSTTRCSDPFGGSTSASTSCGTTGGTAVGTTRNPFLP